MKRLMVALSLLTMWVASVAAVDPAKKTPVLIDTDIGADIDDAFALALAIASPEIELVGVTTVGGGNEYDPYVGQRKDRDDHRAWLVCRFLTQTGSASISVAAGADPQPKMPIDGQIQYRRHPAAIYNRTLKPVKEPAVELMTKLLNERDDLTIVTLGPLTNVARLIKEQPAAAKRIKRLIVMGGSIRLGYEGKTRPELEWNIKNDIPAAQQVFRAGLPLTLIPLDATATVELGQSLRDELFSAQTPLTWQVQNLYELWNHPTPVLFDPVAVAAAFHDRHCKFEDLRIDVRADGMTMLKEGVPQVRVATSIARDDFLRWYLDRVKAHGSKSLPPAPGNLSKLIEPGSFPARVHTFEDYENEIEKRWWMCGKVKGNVCQGVLTQDFDDRQGQIKTMFRAVIFNPVPGPPMGPKTRLKFRYRLSGTDTMRVQLYSLSNGYHRYLSLKGLEQGKWLNGCVDMTEMRRPDGSGGPLAEDERIDDIQFYVDPRAELQIDDVVLYDAAAEGEKRPFPERIFFTGWFDTGKQGKEWPGEFDVVEHAKPRAWKFAQSRAKDGGGQMLEVSLRGPRRLDATSELNLQIRTASKDPIQIEFLEKQGRPIRLRDLIPTELNEWAASNIKIGAPQDAYVDTIRFSSKAREPFGLDDLLLFTPGR
jgi:inosine-uridine nucleoside N-ribohydrolase